MDVFSCSVPFILDFCSDLGFTNSDKSESQIPGVRSDLEIIHLCWDWIQVPEAKASVASAVWMDNILLQRIEIYDWFWGIRLMIMTHKNRLRNSWARDWWRPGGHRCCLLLASGHDPQLHDLRSSVIIGRGGFNPVFSPDSDELWAVNYRATRSPSGLCSGTSS